MRPPAGPDGTYGEPSGMQRSEWRRLAACLAAALVLASLAAQRAQAQTTYSLRDLYDKPHRSQIDSTCPEARAAAETLSGQNPVVSPDQAVDFQKAFVACANRRSVSPDLDKLRYLSLAAAGAAFVEALGSTGDRRAAALKRGYTWSDQLAPVSDGSTLFITLNRMIDGGTTVSNTTSGGAGSVNAPTGGGIYYQYRPERNPFGGNANWLYGSDAAKLRDALAFTITDDVKAVTETKRQSTGR